MGGHARAKKLSKRRRIEIARNGGLARARLFTDQFSDLPVSRQRRWQLRNAEKQKSHAITQEAIRIGKVIRGKCWCGKLGESHHEDYSKPLKIVWLCPEHHRDRHKQIRRQLSSNTLNKGK